MSSMKTYRLGKLAEKLNFKHAGFSDLEKDIIIMLRKKEHTAKDISFTTKSSKTRVKNRLHSLVAWKYVDVV